MTTDRPPDSDADEDAEARQHIPRVVFLGPEDAPTSLRTRGDSSRLGADEVRGEGRTSPGDDHVHRQVVSVDAPAPRLSSIRVAQQPEPVTIPHGRGAARELAADSFDLHRSHGQIPASRRVGQPQEVQRQCVLPRGHVLEREPGSITRQVRPLPQPGIGEVTACEGALMMIEALEQRPRTARGFGGVRRHGSP